jgi:putative CocE/NonD family hydrolase
LSATLYASTSAKDTDWFVSLDEVTPEGETRSLGSGRLRARYRDGVRKTELVEPGAAVQYSLDLWHSAATLPKGSRLRVEIASAYFPIFSRNLNTGENNETGTEFVPATQTILHDEAHPSCVLVPVISLPEPRKRG